MAILNLQQQIKFEERKTICIELVRTELKDKFDIKPGRIYGPTPLVLSDINKAVHKVNELFKDKENFYLTMVLIATPYQYFTGQIFTKGHELVLADVLDYDGNSLMNTEPNTDLPKIKPITIVK